MIQLSALAQSIENELNGSLNAVAMGVKFKIYSTIGNYKKAITKTDGKKQVYVNGILRATTGSYTPVKALNNVDATLMLELAVQQERVEDVQLILSTWTESVVGEVYTMGNWAVLITPQTSIAGVAKNASPIGSMIPLMLMLDTQFIQNGLVSNSVTWTINGETVHPTNVVRSNNRTPDTNPRANMGLTKTVNQFDNETIVMTLPISYNTIIQNILNDVGSHNIEATYQITRSDGFSTSTNQLYVITSCELMEEGGKIAALTLTFSPADLAVSGFILSFDSDGGSSIVSKKVYFGEKIGELSTPTKAGYIFAGWKVDDTIITSDTVWEWGANKTAVAQWVDLSVDITHKYIMAGNGVEIEMACDVPGASIYYTESYTVLPPADPDENSTLYSGKITKTSGVSVTLTIKARAIYGNTYGPITMKSFTYGGVT